MHGCMNTNFVVYDRSKKCLFFFVAFDVTKYNEAQLFLLVIVYMVLMAM